MIPALLTLGAGVTSWLLTGAVRRYALARSVLDIPNHRSSHTTPTPRGGGLAIAAIALGGVALGAVVGAIAPTAAIAIIGGGVLVAGIGWLDDHGGVSAPVRALVHLIAACWALVWLGGLPSLDLGVVELRLGAVGSVLAAIGVVWLTNLYNFMDGIDGIAGGEAVTVGVIGGILLLLSGSAGLATVSFLIAAASGGFLLWNWAPARIFMGDVGSGLLGFLFAVLAIASENAGAVPLLLWVLLLGTFVFDATLTLLRRIARSERWYDAHHSHAYQRAVQAGLGHARVSGAVLTINVALGLLALVGWMRPQLLIPVLGIGAAMLAVIYRRVELIRPMR